MYRMAESTDVMSEWKIYERWERLTFFEEVILALAGDTEHETLIHRWLSWNGLIKQMCLPLSPSMRYANTFFCFRFNSFNSVNGVCISVGRSWQYCIRSFDALYHVLTTNDLILNIAPPALIWAPFTSTSPTKMVLFDRRLAWLVLLSGNFEYCFIPWNEVAIILEFCIMLWCGVMRCDPSFHKIHFYFNNCAEGQAWTRTTSCTQSSSYHEIKFIEEYVRHKYLPQLVGVCSEQHCTKLRSWCDQTIEYWTPSSRQHRASMLWFCTQTNAVFFRSLLFNSFWLR